MAVLREAEFTSTRDDHANFRAATLACHEFDRFRHPCFFAAAHSFAQSAKGPAFVIVERLTTTGPESIQEQYGKVSRDIVAKFAGRYLARSQQNTLLEGEGNPPCCMAILSFPSTEAAKSWFESPENQDAARIRRSGATFRIVSIQGLP
jgi:uncharacterized protein (DUF1330 family)